MELDQRRIGAPCSRRGECKVSIGTLALSSTGQTIEYRNPVFGLKFALYFKHLPVYNIYQSTVVYMYLLFEQILLIDAKTAFIPIKIFINLIQIFARVILLGVLR